MPTISDRLKEARIKRGYETVKAAVAAFGWPYQGYYTHENGLKTVPLEKCMRYAEAFDVDPAWLILGDKRHAPDWLAPVAPTYSTLPLVGSVAAGLWRQGFELTDESVVFNGKAPGDSVAYRVQGDSMDMLVRDGGLAFARRVVAPDCASGQIVVVERVGHDGQYEYTLKECQRAPDGQLYLVPRSSNPAHMPITLSHSDGEIRIVGIVFAFQAPVTPKSE